MWLTSRIHRYLGIGFALLILPVSLGSTARDHAAERRAVGAGLARVLDQSLRYTVDKTTREILFLPLPADIKLKAKSFVDVTVDRDGEGARRAPAPRAGQAVGPPPRLAAAELCQPGGDGALDLHVAPGAARAISRAFRQSIERA